MPSRGMLICPINASDRNRLGIAQVTLSQADAQAARKVNLPALICRGQGQAAPTKETERRARVRGAGFPFGQRKGLPNRS